MLKDWRCRVQITKARSPCHGLGRLAHHRSRPSPAALRSTLAAVAPIFFAPAVVIVLGVSSKHNVIDLATFV